jgi:hypothetical protein
MHAQNTKAQYHSGREKLEEEHLKLEMCHPGYSLQTYEQSPLGKIVHD